MLYHDQNQSEISINSTTNAFDSNTESDAAYALISNINVTDVNYNAYDNQHSNNKNNKNKPKPNNNKLILKLKFRRMLIDQFKLFNRYNFNLNFTISDHENKYINNQSHINGKLIDSQIISELLTRYSITELQDLQHLRMFEYNLFPLIESTLIKSHYPVREYKITDYYQSNKYISTQCNL